MRELNAYQQELLESLKLQGLEAEARKVYCGWLRGINELILAPKARKSPVKYKLAAKKPGFSQLQARF
jgi:hypothetical protein